jgi:hypothetical protein
MRFSSNIRRLVAASVLCVAFAQGASATGVEPAKDMRLDPALCLAAALALLFLVVFPRVEQLLPYQDVNVDTGSVPASSPSATPTP